MNELPIPEDNTPRKELFDNNISWWLTDTGELTDDPEQVAYRIKKDPIDKKAGRYSVIHEVQAGADGAPMAAKIATSYLQNRNASDLALEEEYNILKSLQQEGSHPNLLQVYGFIGKTTALNPEGDYGTNDIMFMDLITDSKKEWSMDEIPNILLQIASADDFALDNHIIHRDLSPNNILLANDGHATLVDFSLAFDDRWEDVNDRHKNVAGTLSYLSPERALVNQIRTAEQYRKSDVFTLASIAYEMITEEQLFEAPEVPETRMKTAREIHQANGLGKNEERLKTALVIKVFRPKFRIK